MSLETILSGCVGILCGALFAGLGIHGFTAKKPVTFWAGTKIKPEDVRDIKGYNRANGRMWLIYSIPWWVAGVLGFLNEQGAIYSYLYLIVLILAGSVCLWWVILHYQKIANEFLT